MKKILTYMGKPVLTVSVALFLGIFLILPTGTSPVEAYRALFIGAFGTWGNLFNSLARATPLLFTGLAAAFAFRGGVFNIGAEGQMFMGAFAASLIGIYLGWLPGFVVQPLALLAAIGAGGLWGSIPGFLNSKLKINIVISTIMLNNIAILLTSYLATYPFKGELDIGATFKVSETAQLLRFSKFSTLNMGFVIGIIVVIVLYALIYKTSFGYELRGFGSNPKFTTYLGIDPGKKVVSVIIISGMLAGVAGAEQTLGVNLRFISEFSPGYAFTGITVALLGRLNPFGVLVGAIFFGGLTSGAVRMEALTNVSRDLINSLQGIIILLLAAEQLLSLESRNKIYKLLKPLLQFYKKRKKEELS
ncbi:MAG: ABC transporter permease [Bacteroidetes bacterium]|nr:ABC transporter permease [Bacteroidota bacterium]